MTDDEDSPLTEVEAARFDDIVGREWPRADLGEAAPSDCLSALALETAGPAPGHITVYRPRRPPPLLAVVGLITLGATLAATRHWGLAALNATVDRTLSTAMRVDAAHMVALVGGAAGVGVAVSITMFGAWVVAYARYRLRRSALRIALTRTVPPVERRIRPPSIATALAWTGTLVGVTIAAGWWLPNQLALLAAGRSAELEQHLTGQLTLAAIAWSGIAVACMTGLTAWACREGRHQIRVTANRSRTNA